LFPPHVAILGILAIIFVALSKCEFDQSAAKASSGTPSSTAVKSDVTPPKLRFKNKGQGVR
jgi:hypothetical protein